MISDDRMHWFTCFVYLKSMHLCVHRGFSSLTKRESCQPGKTTAWSLELRLRRIVPGFSYCNPEFLNLDASDFLGQLSFCCGAVQCIMECLEAPLVPVLLADGSSSELWHPKVSLDISKCPQGLGAGVDCLPVRTIGLSWRYFVSACIRFCFSIVQNLKWQY